VITKNKEKGLVFTSRDGNEREPFMVVEDGLVRMVGSYHDCYMLYLALNHVHATQTASRSLSDEALKRLFLLGPRR
jgi:hypothetical protein